jgi:hypothetical protein
MALVRKALPQAAPSPLRRVIQELPVEEEKKQLDRLRSLYLETALNGLPRSTTRDLERL